MDKQYITYILHCADDTYYVGKTVDLKKRLRQHNGEIKGGAKYTRGRRPVSVYYTEFFTTNLASAQREYILKQLTHEEKKRLLFGDS